MLILLRRLVEHEVRFVLVGGMAAAAYGSSIVIRAKHAMGRPKDLRSARELELILAKTRG